jgi:hypothetical protein
MSGERAPGQVPGGVNTSTAGSGRTPAFWPHSGCRHPDLGGGPARVVRAAECSRAGLIRARRGVVLALRGGQAACPAASRTAKPSLERISVASRPSTWMSRSPAPCRSGLAGAGTSPASGSPGPGPVSWTRTRIRPDAAQIRAVTGAAVPPGVHIFIIRQGRIHADAQHTPVTPGRGRGDSRRASLQSHRLW